MSKDAWRIPVACSLSVTGIAVTYLGCVRWWGALLSAAVLAWCALPGVLLARKFTGRDTGVHWLWGPVWGIGLSALGLLALWELRLHAFWILIAAPWPAWLLLAVPRRFAIPLRGPALDRRDVVAVAILLLLIPAIVGLPYGHIANAVGDSAKAYRAYFTADFVWAMSVVAEVSKGDLPPVNPFQLGGTLHYYWLAHFLSAVEYRAFHGLGLTIEEVTLANSIGYAAVFIAFLYGFVRAFGASAAGATAACAMVFAANSFEALDRAIEWWRDYDVFPLLTTINVDAVTRWYYAGMPVDGLHRMLLYQPHHLVGYALGLSALLVVSRCADAGRGVVALAVGVLLGMSLLFSSFIAIIFGVTVAIVYAVRLLWPLQWRQIALCAVLGAAPIALAYEMAQALAYVDPAAEHLVEFGVNPVAAMHWPYALLLSFGPMLLVGAAGLALAARTRSRDLWPIAALLAVAFAFYFLVDVPDMQSVWVGWRAGHLVFVACTVLTASLLTTARGAHPAARAGVYACVIVAVLVALPTVAMDVFNAQDITNAGNGPGFPWTLRLSALEVEALDWLKAHTPPNVIVQPNVYERSTASWGYMPAFGERRMAAGLPIAMIPFKPYQEASEKIARKVFDSGSPSERAVAARRFGIDYLYVGPAETERHPDLVPIFDSRSDLFPVVFRNKEVVIYWVAPDERRPISSITPSR